MIINNFYIISVFDVVWQALFISQSAQRTQINLTERTENTEKAISHRAHRVHREGPWSFIPALPENKKVFTLCPLRALREKEKKWILINFHL